MPNVGIIIQFPMRKRMAEWQGFYSRAQVSRLAGIPRRTLYDWKARGIIAPSVHVLSADLLADDGYSYADLAIIKLMRGLRNRQLNLRSVAGALRHLYDRFGPPTSTGWKNAHVFVVGKEVFAQKPDEWETTAATQYGQKAETRVLGELFEEEAAILIPKEFRAYVEINLDVMDGQPVIRNTRVLTSTVAMMYEEGTSLAELTELYAPVPRIPIQNAIDFERALDKVLTPA